MSNQLSENKLVTRRASKDDWSSILALLEETRLSFWFTGEENYKNFFVVIDTEINETINCFAIYIEDKVGILKQFAVSKKLQGKGVGKYIANVIIPKAAKEIDLEELYLQGGNKEPFTSIHFWKRTAFKHIDKDEIKNSFIKNYIVNLEKNLPEHFFREATFYIKI